MEAARRQGITRRRRQRETHFGWAINAKQLASRSQPVDSSTSGAASRPCSPVLPYSGCRGEEKGAFEKPIRPYLSQESLVQERANGAVAQMGNLGSTTGPPLFAALSSWLGVAGLALPVLAFALATWTIRHRP